MALVVPSLMIAALSLLPVTEGRLERSVAPLDVRTTERAQLLNCRTHLIEISDRLPSRSADRYPEVRRVLALYEQAVIDCDGGHDLVAMERIRALRRDLALTDQPSVGRDYPTKRP